jgi:hypothetical protein
VTKNLELPCKFELQEIGPSQYGVVCRVQTPDQIVINGNEPYLRLKAGVTYGFAEQVVKFLQQNIIALGVKKIGDRPGEQRDLAASPKVP